MDNYDYLLRDKIKNYDKIPSGIRENLKRCIEQIERGNYRYMSDNQEAYSAAISEGLCKDCLNDQSINNKIQEEIKKFIREYIAENRR